MKVAIVGTHNHMTDWMKVRIHDVIQSTHRLDIIITGCAEGVDKCVRDFASKRRALIVVHAAWDTFHTAAGPMRNALIADISDICNAFPWDETSRGTFNCMGAFRRRGKPVRQFGELIPDGVRDYYV